MAATIVVQGLPDKPDREDLHQFLETVSGQSILLVTVRRACKEKDSMAHAFVRVSDNQAARSVINSCDKRQYRGSTLSLRISTHNKLGNAIGMKANPNRKEKCSPMNLSRNRQYQKSQIKKLQEQDRERGENISLTRALEVDDTFPSLEVGDDTIFSFDHFFLGKQYKPQMILKKWPIFKEYPKVKQCKFEIKHTRLRFVMHFSLVQQGDDAEQQDYAFRTPFENIVAYWAKPIKEIKRSPQAKCTKDWIGDETVVLFLQLGAAPNIIRRTKDDYVQTIDNFSKDDNVGKCDTWVLFFPNMKQLDPILTELQNILFTIEPLTDPCQLLEPWEVKTPINIRDLNCDNTGLPFDVLFWILSLISNGLLLEENCSQEFIKYVTGKDPGIICSILESLLLENKKIWDPLESIKQKNRAIIRKRTKEKLDENYFLIPRIIVTPTRVILKGYENEIGNRVLRMYKHLPDSFIRVTFADEHMRYISYDEFPLDEVIDLRVKHILTDGLKIAGRQFSFLGYSSSQLREHSTWFFAPQWNLSINNVIESLGDFKSIRVASKYASRVGLCFSQTIPTISLEPSSIGEDEDVERNGYCFTDGCSRISTETLKEVTEKFRQSTGRAVSSTAFQFRFGGAKGVLSLDPTLTEHKVKFRKSCVKFKSKINTIEVSNFAQYNPVYLNRQLITLLSDRGIPVSFFRDMLEDDLTRIETLGKDEVSGKVKVGASLTRFPISGCIQAMLDAGFNPQTEQFLARILVTMQKNRYKRLVEKTSILVEKGCRLMGVVDTTGKLQDGQVFIRFHQPNEESPRIITGRVAVARSPCLHPGDVRVLQAVDLLQLNYHCNVIVFPQNGTRPHPNEMSGGDLDGDDYFITWDERLIPANNFPAMNFASNSARSLLKVSPDDVIEFITQYFKNGQLGIIAETWLALADKKGAQCEDCVRLAELHSKAVDYPKSGCPAVLPKELRCYEFPTFMEKPLRQYRSEKVIGVMYDRTKEVMDRLPAPSVEEFEDPKCLVDGYSFYVEEARRVFQQFNLEIQRILNYYELNNEFEAFTATIFSIVRGTKFFDMQQKLNDDMSNLLQSYTQKFEYEFGEKSAQHAKKKKLGNIDYKCEEEKQKQASAWYHVAYNQSECDNTNNFAPSYLGFAWIPWRQLCTIFKNKSKNSMVGIRRHQQEATRVIKKVEEKHVEQPKLMKQTEQPKLLKQTEQPKLMKQMEQPKLLKQMEQPKLTKHVEPALPYSPWANGASNDFFFT